MRMIAGCTFKSGDTDPLIIEEGYLTEARLGVTYEEGASEEAAGREMVVFGLAGATNNTGVVEIVNASLDLVIVAEVSEEGAFTAPIEAEFNQTLTLRRLDSDVEAQLITATLPSFPPLETDALSTPSADLVTLELVFVDEQPEDRSFFMVNRSHDAVSHDFVRVGTHIYYGRVHAWSGDDLFVYGRGADLVATESLHRIVS
jgi:hypothetical protein